LSHLFPFFHNHNPFEHAIPLYKDSQFQFGSVFVNMIALGIHFQTSSANLCLDYLNISLETFDSTAMFIFIRIREVVGAKLPFTS